MRELGSRKVSCSPVVLRSTSANSSGSKRLEFAECHLHRPRMGLKNANVLAKKSRERNGLRWRKREVEEYPAIGRSLAAFRSRAVQSLRQRLSRYGMLVLAEPQKVIGTHLARQTEPSRANALPFPGHTLAFVVVVADAEMLFEVFLRVRQVVLRLGRDHRRRYTELRLTLCITRTFGPSDLNR